MLAETVHEQGNSIVKTITSSTHTDVSTTEIKTQIPHSLILHPRLQEMIEHSDNEVHDAVNALKVVNESTSSTVDALMQNMHVLQNIPTPAVQEEVQSSSVVSEVHVLPNTFKGAVPKEDRPAHLLHSSAVDSLGHNVSRKNRDITGRRLVLISSKMLNQIHCTTHIGYTSRTLEQAIKFARNDLSKQGVTYELSQARDLTVQVLNETYTAQDIKIQKRNKMLELINDGWEVLGLFPKV